MIWLPASFNGRKNDYDRFEVKAHLFAELTAIVQHRDDLGRVMEKVAYFKPVKMLWGSWSVTREVRLGADVSNLRLIEGRIFELWLDRDNEVRHPCHTGLPFYERESFESIEF